MRVVFILLSYIDDVNWVWVGRRKVTDNALQKATGRAAAGLRCGEAKACKVEEGTNMRGRRRHQKYRAAKAWAAWEEI